MHQQEYVCRSFEAVDDHDDQNVHLRSTERKEATDFTFEAVKPGIFRTTFFSRTHPLPPWPSASIPDVCTSSPEAEISSNATSKTFNCINGVVASVDWANGPPIVSVGYTDLTPLHTDLPFRSYVLDGSGVAHYTRYHRNDLHIGLGEKAAPMDLSNRHFTLSATDCFGYDVHRTDPMYKHIPLLIRATPQGIVATFSVSHARGYFSVGSEMDGMWGPFKVYRQAYGGLELYTMIGGTLQEVVRLYADIVGFPQLVPRWAFGYLAGGMKYSMLDTPRANDVLMEFAEKLKLYDIPCSGFQMSSGYTVAEKEPKTRNVFTWNKHRFPDPKAFCDAFHARGIKLIANIKPYVLASHPEYERLMNAGALFVDPGTKKSAVARLWSAGGGESGEGGHIDFTSKAGYEFWYSGVKELRKTGMDCMWNDNNEFVIPADDWRLELSHSAAKEAFASMESDRRDIGLWGRALHTELNARCSYEALTEVMPNERPFILTRSATAGTMRYAASTWSGDNVTSWDSMRGANALSINAGMCLLQSYGHDIGGFEGTQPSPELLLRWVQLGIHSPRFAINCFKTLEENNVGDVIEPWMYPHILPEIRHAIKRRYELIPYLYSLMLQSHFTATPPQRWTGWGYESDSEVWSSKVLKDGETQYWLGDTLLVGGVYEPGVSDAKIYLPKSTNDDAGFLNTKPPYQYLSAGKWYTIAAPWKTVGQPILARIGGAVPVGKGMQVLSPGEISNPAKLPIDDWRGVEIFPPPEEHSDGTTTYLNTWLEDDGISPSPPKFAKFVLAYVATGAAIAVSFRRDISGGFAPPWLDKGLTVILPVGDSRAVVSSDESMTVESRRQDDSGRRRYHISADAQAQARSSKL